MTPFQPKLDELMARYLERQASANAAGLGHAEVSGEVVPFEATPVQIIDPRLAWDGAVAALSYAGGKLPSVPVPADWPALVAAHEPVTALAFCAGNFPQMVRSFYPLVQGANLTALRPTTGRPLPAPTLVAWAEEQARGGYPGTLLALGALRVAGEFDRAAERIARGRDNVPRAWRSAWANEEAALAWHRGQAEEAAQLWRAQDESVPVLFNRGMAALFLGRPREGRPWLLGAVEQLPEDNAWHHLGRLYLALAEIHAA